MDLNEHENMGNKKTSVDLPFNLWRTAKMNLVEFKEALEFGILFKLAEKDGGIKFDYPTNSLTSKVERLTKLLQAKSQECEVLRDQLENGKEKSGENSSDEREHLTGVPLLDEAIRN